MSPQPRTTPDAAPASRQDAQAFTDSLCDKGDDLRQHKLALFEQIAANRDMLRNLVKSDMATTAQVARIDTLYPPRTRKAKDNGDGS